MNVVSLQAAAWYQHLIKSAERMRDLAGTSDQPLSIDLDAESASIISSVSRDDLQKAASSGQPPSAEQGQSPLEVAVSLGEVALYVSGRPCETWWPPEVCILRELMGMLVAASCLGEYRRGFLEI